MAMNLVGMQAIVNEFTRQFNDPTYRFSAENYLNGPWGCTCILLASPPPNPPSVPAPAPTAYVTSITVTPANFMVPQGQSQQMVATAVYSDQTSGDVTTAVVWSITGQPIPAIISSTGFLTGTAGGNSGTVLATLPTAGQGGTQVQGSTSLYVNTASMTMEVNPTAPAVATPADIALYGVNCGHYCLIGPINDSSPLSAQIAPYVQMLQQMLVNS
jgi:Bacterial Ig-like domain (group 2)